MVFTASLMNHFCKKSVCTWTKKRHNVLGPLRSSRGRTYHILEVEQPDIGSGMFAPCRVFLILSQNIRTRRDLNFCKFERLGVLQSWLEYVQFRCERYNNDDENPTYGSDCDNPVKLILSVLHSAGDVPVIWEYYFKYKIVLGQSLFMWFGFTFLVYLLIFRGSGTLSVECHWVMSKSTGQICVVQALNNPWLLFVACENSKLILKSCAVVN